MFLTIMFVTSVSLLTLHRLTNYYLCNLIIKWLHPYHKTLNSICNNGVLQNKKIKYSEFVVSIISVRFKNYRALTLRTEILSYEQVMLTFWIWAGLGGLPLCTNATDIAVDCVAFNRRITGNIRAAL
jgi:hypothetical protein